MPEILAHINLILLLLAIGGIGGFLSGLLGVGGGFLFVPALYFCLTALGYESNHAMHIAVGTSLAVMIATGMTSAIGHFKRHSVDFVILKSWGPFIVMGVGLGSVTASSVDGFVLTEIFAGLTLLVALYMFFGKGRVDSADRPIPQSVQSGMSFFVGMISSMIGIGGSTMSVPLMSYVGIPIQRAVGTAAAMGIMVSIPGALAYMFLGYQTGGLPPYSIGFVNFLSVALIIPSSIIMAPLGVQAAHTLPRAMLRRVFAILLLIVSARMFYTLFHGF